jgi:glycosyltransferase involved in cell wall biosynthesis
LKKISIFIPTLNAELHIKECITSIVRQDYPKKLKEIIIIDGGSSDKTLDICKSFGCKIFNNPKKSAHYGFTIFAKVSTGDLLINFAADNVFTDKNYFKLIDFVFKKKEITFFWGRQISGLNDSAINKYYELIQSDPFSFFANKNLEYYLNNAKKINFNGFKYFVFKYLKNKPLVWGANGLVLRSSYSKRYYLSKNFVGDNDVFIKTLKGRKISYIAFSQNYKIIHHHVKNLKQWIYKMHRNFSKHFITQLNNRNINWLSNELGLKALYWSAYSFNVVIPLLHGLLLSILKKNKFWMYHGLINTVQFYIYIYIVFRNNKFMHLLKFLKK